MPVAKTKSLISCAVTAQLICVFVFASAKHWFSHDVTQMNYHEKNLILRTQNLTLSYPSFTSIANFVQKEQTGMANYTSIDIDQLAALILVCSIFSVFYKSESLRLLVES